MIKGWTGAALNTAPDSQNEIHGDEIAQQFGFKGGLVPGVTISAYLIQPAIEAWGLEWLQHGHAHVRVASPLYDGETFSVDVNCGGNREYQAELIRPDGTICATADVILPTHLPAAPVRRGDAIADKHHVGAEASPERFAELQRQGCLAYRYRWGSDHRMSAYIEDASAMPGLLRTDGGGYANMSFLLGISNWVFASNAHMNPWVHLETTSQNYRAVADGTVVIAEMSVEDYFEKKGHQFADVLVNLFDEANDEALCSIQLRAIYKLRGT